MDRLIAANSVPMAQADTAPTTGTPQGATDGNAATNVPATRWPSYQYNAIQEELIAILGGANIAPDRTNNAQILAAIRALIAQSAAVIGDRRNLVSKVAAASSTKTITADEIVVGSALGGQKTVLASFSGTGNLATTGLNGMDTGSAPVSGFVAEYAVYNPTTGAKGLLYTNATSSVAPNVYGGSNPVSGYTASALLGVWATNASGQFKIGYQLDRTFSVPSTNVLTTATSASTPTALSLSSAVPMNAKLVSGLMGLSSSATSSMIISVYSDANNCGQQNTSNPSLTATVPFYGNYSVTPPTPQTIYYTATSTAGTPLYVIYVSGYSI
ncbi:hypothetical protein [Paraburkholderia nodosa]|uniref:hypothetical protein n=1 Tax=Paraburkholderia nodosa TaxID=392320 RepID=UPI001FE1B823|nr:hypothetical protein [Paraburkholderia nodosa]